MKQIEFNEFLERVFERIRRVLKNKSNEYSTEQDKLINFKEGAVALQVAPEYYARMLQFKHIISINDIIKKNQKASEDMILEKFIDEINYSILILALLKEKYEYTY